MLARTIRFFVDTSGSRSPVFVACRVKHESAERRLARATQAAEKALKSQSGARGKVQKAKSDQAEVEALANKSFKSARCNLEEVSDM